MELDATPPHQRPLARLVGLLLLLLAIVVQFGLFSAEYFESKVWLTWAAFLLIVVLISALRSVTFRFSRHAIVALLLTLGGCMTQAGLAQLDDTEARVASFTCAEGRRIVAERQGLGRTWVYLGNDTYVARATPVHGSEIYMRRYHNPVDGEWYGLLTGGWDRDPLGSADCATSETAARGSSR